MRFVYSTHKTRVAAEAALEEYFTTGEVCAAEYPLVEFRKGRYVVTVEG